jgi:hypothetical protein
MYGGNPELKNSKKEVEFEIFTTIRLTATLIDYFLESTFTGSSKAEKYGASLFRSVELLQEILFVSTLY